jgi:hypothetical protein
LHGGPISARTSGPGCAEKGRPYGETSPPSPSCRRAEELAAEAHRLLGQGDGQVTAGVWAAVAQAPAVLAVAAATAVAASGADHRTWADARRDQAGQSQGRAGGPGRTARQSSKQQ